jgi:hypothetical protein
MEVLLTCNHCPWKIYHNTFSECLIIVHFAWQFEQGPINRDSTDTNAYPIYFSSFYLSKK